MNKIKASIVVIGFQNEDHKMHPHLYDFMQNLRSIYDDVVYIKDDDRGWGLYVIDRDIQSIKTDLNIKHFKALPHDLINLFIYSVLYIKGLRKFIKRIKNVNSNSKHNKTLVLAIDNYAFFIAQKYFSSNVILWSYDILTEDCPTRIKNGFLEKLITYNSKHPSNGKVLMIQDEQRKKILEESMMTSFLNTIYLPVSLNDSEFCRKASKSRQERNSFSIINIIQMGYISEGRWSNQLIDAYQNWPRWYKLHLHGYIEIDKQIIINAQRKPNVSESIYDHDVFPQILHDHDIGFIGYKEKDGNHSYLENASAQLVMFLRLGIPVIGCGTSSFNSFINKNNIGLSLTTLEEMEGAIKQIIDNYSFFSYNARKLYELKFNLDSIFTNNLIKSFESLYG